MSRDFVVNVADIVRRPASRIAVDLDGRAGDDVVVGEVGVPEGSIIDAHVELESLTDGIVVSGRIASPWSGTCRRCLGPASGTVVVEVRELYQLHPATDEAYHLEGDLVDLGPMVRENLMLDLPIAPLCRPDCAGLCAVCGADRNHAPCGCDEAPLDPRWSVLDVLADRLDPPAS